MFAFCEDPSTLSNLPWMACYLTTGKQFLFYGSFLTVLALIFITAPVALLFGFGGAMAARSSVLPLRWFGKTYVAMVRGVPDIVYFMFFVIALDQGLEWIRHKIKCPDWDQPIRQGNDFVVCAAAKLPQSSAPQWVHETYGIILAIAAFAFVVIILLTKCPFHVQHGPNLEAIEVVRPVGVVAVVVGQVGHVVGKTDGARLSSMRTHYESRKGSGHRFHDRRTSAVLA